MALVIIGVSYPAVLLSRMYHKTIDDPHDVLVNTKEICWVGLHEQGDVSEWVLVRVLVYPFTDCSGQLNKSP